MVEPQLINSTLEPNTHNKSSSTVTLYFDGEPTLERIREVCKTRLTHLALGVDTEDPFFGFEEHPSPLSKRSGLRRYEVYPTG